MAKDDDVANLSHYKELCIEPLDVTDANESTEALIGAYRKDINKYIWRFDKKDGIRDLKKAQYYLQRLIGTLEDRGWPNIVDKE